MRTLCVSFSSGTAADITGGQVEIVDPLQLSTKVVSLLNKVVVATNLQLTIIANEDFHFKNEEKSSFFAKRDFGNVTVCFVVLELLTWVEG
jgi:hypothetical protein